MSIGEIVNIRGLHRARAALRRWAWRPVLAGALALAACGGGDRKRADSSGPAGGKNVEQRLQALEDQAELLGRQTQSMRREVESRLGQIEETRKGLGVQVASLRSELGGPRSALPPEDAAARNAAKTAPAASSAEKPAPPEESEGSGWFLRLVLVIVILTAIAFMARIFFGRWGSEEDGEPLGAGGMTDLGKLRAHAAEGAQNDLDEPPTDAERRNPDEDDQV